MQSPTDYAFIRHVVNEHWPYYAYADLQARHPALGWRERKLGELYLRLANHLQPPTLIDLEPTCPAYADYFKAGCRKARLLHSLSGVQEAGLLRLDIGHPQLEEALRLAGCRTLVVVEGIHQGRAALSRWRELRKREEVRVSFDLYYCGILTFDRKRYKKDYTVNF